MKYLVIHPEDPSTDCLKAVYMYLSEKTVITGHEEKSLIQGLIHVHDRIIILGHGTPHGLLGSDYSFVVDSSYAPLLQQKECVCIWCFAGDFAEHHGLRAFCSGMFISEYEEAAFFQVPADRDKMDVEESFTLFSESLGRHITEDLDICAVNVMEEYEILIHSNRVARYNWERLRLLNYCAV